MVPGDVGTKASGYYHPDLSRAAVVSPFLWQLRKMWDFQVRGRGFNAKFDSYVAGCILRQSLNAKVLVTLQDYMPKTVEAARARGWRIWSDQISNQSAETAARIAQHERDHGLPSSWSHDESHNQRIVEQADLVTLPSTYCLDGVRNQISRSAKLRIIPYGADSSQFCHERVDDPEEVVVLARAHSVRKGGHLLCHALRECGAVLLNLTSPKKMRVIILGSMDSPIKELYDNLVLPSGISVEHGNVPHLRVQALYRRAAIFVMPSLSESLSLACLEAMHAGLPMIVTRYCGIDGFVHGDMGYEVADTVESLTEALVNAFREMHCWPRWGAEARAFAGELTWSTYENAISEAASEILA
jgi:glycosyltransferase involved in cell wall biosynthesis